jgi:hypothetical protein
MVGFLTLNKAAGGRGMSPTTRRSSQATASALCPSPGIYVRVVDRAAPYSKKPSNRIMTEQLFGVAQAMNLIPDDPEETLGRALVPALPWGDVAPSAPGRSGDPRR